MTAMTAILISKLETCWRASHNIVVFKSVDITMALLGRKSETHKENVLYGARVYRIHN